MLPDEEIMAMVLDCQKRDSKLSEWEYDFIEGIFDQIGFKALSEKQIETLEKIWERIT
jgi:hypothetical protein